MTQATNQVALVTGSATGVGRACALRFAELGFDLVINYAKSAAEAQETVDLVTSRGRRAVLCQADIRDDAAVRGMFAEIERSCGRLDVLVNNAAMTHFVDHADLDGMTAEKWDEILSVNVKGTFFVTRAAVPLLRRADQAAIVNISSVAGLSGVGSSIAYCASKAAVNSMTKSFARVLAPRIRVNAVCPGPIDTRWLRQVLTEEQLRERTKEYPIPRAAQPEDIADAVLYLATGTTLTTGQLLVVDGGRTM
jgi:3-oxoacyl-[acyl-carrier protein] reductase